MGWDLFDCSLSFPLCISHPEAQEILQGWNLRFDKELVNFDARVLPTEKIFQTSKQVSRSISISDLPAKCTLHQGVFPTCPVFVRRERR